MHINTINRTASLPGTNTHIPVLNSLRAIAALSVCLFHYICTVTGYTTNEILLVIFNFGQYGVHMFFVISGFIIPWSMYHGQYEPGNFFRFITKRLIRLEPLFLCSLALAVLHAYARTRTSGYNGVDTTPSLQQVALHIGYLVPFFEDAKWIRPVYWTLAIEFQYYFVMGMIFPFLVNKQMLLRFMVYVIFSLGVLLPDAGLLPFYLPIFMLGVLLFLKKTSLISDPEFYLMSAVCLVIIFMKHDTGSFGFSLATYLIILYFSHIKSKIGDFLGEISYSLYLFHSLTGMVVLNYFSHFVQSPLLKTVILLVAVGVAIVCSYITYRLIEYPTKRWSSRIRYKKPVSPQTATSIAS